ncbi:MAG: M20 family metallopeptidase [Erysipelotrichaceae bacterium]|nr:M20 family metallopeptidase [Erysipelotrichaceae bacterium]
MIDTKNIMNEAYSLEEKIRNIRRELHIHPETGFDLKYTKPFVRERLEELGYTVEECGKAGLVTTIGKNNGKCILLRADMDALPIKEEADIDYKSVNEGFMHGCGHDMHTAMLLGAAELLKNHEEELKGTVKLMFQPAEEIFQGSSDMINNGVLENPHVDAAIMLHVVGGMPIKEGAVLIPSGGVTTASCEQYHITIQGKGGHGSMPQNCIDPITAASAVHLALQEVNARELEAGEYGVFTTGKFVAGDVSNVIPDKAEMWGTIRTLNDNARLIIKTRMSEIVEGISAAYRCKGETDFFDYCPTMITDNDLSVKTMSYVKELIGQGAIDMSLFNGGKPGSGSEDFAFVSHEVPTVGMFITAGDSTNGYPYSQHHPKVCFNDDILYIGSAVHAYTALRWLSEN